MGLQRMISESQNAMSGAIIAPEIGDGLEVRFQAPQQPDDLMLR
jgi:hypothetical protein